MDNLSQDDTALHSNHSMPSGAVMKLLLTTASRHKMNKTTAKKTALLTTLSSFASPVDKAGPKTSRSISVGLLLLPKVLDDACPSSGPKSRGQRRGCGISEEGEEVLLLRTDANMVKAQF